MRKIVILPNIITGMNLFFGVLALMFIFNEDYFTASICIFTAMLFDLLDGQVARWQNATSKFGLEFDSLSDVVSFGVAPGMLAYGYYIRDLNELGAVIVAVYILACGVRLAKFNVLAQTSTKKSFSGLPSPAAAGVVCSTLMIIMRHENLQMLKIFPLTVLLAGVLMVSAVKYPVPVNFIMFLKNKITGVPRLALLGLLFYLLFTNTEFLLFTVFVGYAFFGVVRAVFARAHFWMPVKNSLHQLTRKKTSHKH